MVLELRPNCDDCDRDLPPASTRARTYLNAIAGDPEGVVRALARVPKRPPAE